VRAASSPWKWCYAGQHCGSEKIKMGKIINEALIKHDEELGENDKGR